MEKIRSDPFAVPESFETADELVDWLARLAESITSWYALVKGLRAWSATEQVRRDMLTYDQHRAAHAAFQKANDGFRERAFQWSLKHDPRFADLARRRNQTAE